MTFETDSESFDQTIRETASWTARQLDTLLAPKAGGGGDHDNGPKKPDILYRTMTCAHVDNKLS